MWIADSQKLKLEQVEQGYKPYYVDGQRLIVTFPKPNMQEITKFIHTLGAMPHNSLNNVYSIQIFSYAN